MQAITLRCPACGSTLKLAGNETHINCEYCQNPVNLIKPLTSNTFVEGLSEIEQNKYRNYLSILEQAMLAGNYIEGYEYCNKGLEINPKSAELWANKAICSLWISTVSQISEDKAMEIIAYLNACRQNEADENIFEDTSKSIAENLYYCALYRYNMIQPDEYAPSGHMAYSFNSEKAIVSCIRVMQLCFQIYPDYSYLIQALRILSSGKIHWLNNNGTNSNHSLRQGFDAIRMREKLIEEIKKDYSIDKLESKAQTNYQAFCKLSDEFYGIDKKLYHEYFVPIRNKFKPVKPPLSPEEIKAKKRKKRICYGVFFTVILITLLLVLFSFLKEKRTEESKMEPIVYADSLQNLKNEFDKKYLNREFLSDKDESVFAQKTIVLVNSNLNKNVIRQIIDFYKDYYSITANKKYNNRFVLILWFYTKNENAKYNPTKLSEFDITQEKNLLGYLIYNYDTKTTKGTIE